MRNKSIPRLTFFSMLAFATSLYANDRHVLLIGLDGCRSDAFFKVTQSLSTYSTFQDFMRNSVINTNLYAGGQLDDGSFQFTLSEPGWTTILTGVWANQHHIRTNGDLEKNKYNHDVPTLFNYIKKYLPESSTALYTDWSPMEELAHLTYFGKDAADISRLYPYKDLNEVESSDAQMTQEIAETIQTKAPTFIFAHYGNPDEAGHVYGFDPQSTPYLNAIQNEIGNIDTLIQAVHQSEQQGQKWMILITTDHGGHSHTHGTQVPEDRAIFSVCYTTDPQELMRLPPPQGQIVFAPSILNFYGVKP